MTGKNQCNMFYFSYLVIVFLISCLHGGEGVSVMSVDFGTEWMKVAIVSPGVPMEIALNKESKRKTPVAIAFRDGERTFGEDALNIGVRFPKQCYVYLLDLLGKEVENPVVKLFQERFPYYDIVPDPVRKTVVFQHDANTQFSIEELVAMMLKKAQEMAIIAAAQPINEAVITVPGYFNQAERKAMLQAAELAEIKVLQLINDYTAVALNYGIFRRKDFNETAQYIMLYDMGASSSTATVISYQLVKTKEKGYVESHPQLSVIGVGCDRTLGGLEMQLRLRDYLAQKFNELKKTDKDVFKNPRSMAKLFKEAGRLKNVLSANADHFAQVEGLIDEVDFKLQVTREQFEKLCTDLFDRVQSPVVSALKSAGLTMEIMGQVILVGAGTRVPAVQEKLLGIVGSELGKNLNTDEAAVLGAVYKAADLSAGFKVKKFITRDGVLYPVQVTFERETDAGSKLVKRTLFGLMNPYPQKKILTFNKYVTDFDFNVVYGDLDFMDQKEIGNIGSLHLSKVSLSGVAEAIAKLKGPNVDIKGVKAHFNMDDSGILKLSNVELVVEKTMTEKELNAADESPLSKLGNTISKLFTSEDTSKETVEEKPVHEEKEEGKDAEKKEDKVGDANKTSEADDKEDPKKTKETEAAKPKPVLFKENITSKEESFIISDFNPAQLEKSQKKLAELNANDEERRNRESTLNALESFAFETQSRLETEEYVVAISPEEKEKISETVKKVSEWLDEESMTSDAGTLLSKLKELQELTGKWYIRVIEHRERPDALSTLNNMLNGSRNFLLTVKNVTENTDPSQGSIFTAVEMETLEKAIKSTEAWIEKSVSEQNKLQPSENPKLTVKMISDKMASLDREVQYLVTKAKIWKPKPTTEEKTKGPSSNTTGSNDNEPEEVVIEKAEESEVPENKTAPEAEVEVTEEEAVVTKEVPKASEPSIPPEEELKSNPEPSLLISAVVVISIHLLFHITS